MPNLIKGLLPINFMDGIRLAMEASGALPPASRTYEFAEALENMIKARDPKLFDLQIEVLENGKEMALAKWCNDTAFCIEDGYASFWLQANWSSAQDYREALEIVSQSRYTWPISKKTASRTLLTSDKHLTGYVYVIQGDTYCKIGMALNVDARLAQFCPKLPWATQIVFQARVINRTYVEKYLHNYFADKRSNGEWFNLDQDDIASMQDVVAMAVAEYTRSKE